MDSGTDASPSGGKAFGATQTIATVEISPGNGLYDILAITNA